MKKHDSLLIVIIVVIVVIFGGTGIGIYLVANYEKGSDGNNSSVSSVEPVLDLKLSTNEENQESVEILATATTSDNQGIASITLPDETIVNNDSANYEVKQNGNYTFKAEGKNGKTTALSIEVKNIAESSDVNPYIPTGFTHTEGEVSKGFIISDQYGNEFVWVPVKSGKLIRKTDGNEDYAETNSTASELVNSVAQNYGFYIARYEACVYEKDGETVAGSIKSQKPWTNVTYQNASSASSKAAQIFGYTDYRTALMNSYAWDSTLSWIDSSAEVYSSNTSYGNYSGDISRTGETATDMVNNIADMSGNVREWTTEIYKKPQKQENTNNTNNTSSSSSRNKNTVNEEVVQPKIKYRVIRGGSANLSRTAQSHTGYDEKSSNEYWGFRMILYK